MCGLLIAGTMVLLVTARMLQYPQDLPDGTLDARPTPAPTDPEAVCSWAPLAADLLTAHDCACLGQGELPFHLVMSMTCACVIFTFNRGLAPSPGLLSRLSPSDAHSRTMRVVWMAWAVYWAIMIGLIALVAPWNSTVEASRSVSATVGLCAMGCVFSLTTTYDLHSELRSEVLRARDAAEAARDAADASDDAADPRGEHAHVQ